MTWNSTRGKVLEAINIFVFRCKLFPNTFELLRIHDYQFEWWSMKLSKMTIKWIPWNIYQSIPVTGGGGNEPSPPDISFKL